MHARWKKEEETECDARCQSSTDRKEALFWKCEVEGGRSVPIKMFLRSSPVALLFQKR